jgi:hypothetical protein
MSFEETDWFICEKDVHIINNWNMNAIDSDVM